MEEVLGVVVFEFWMKFYPKMGKKAPKMGLLGKKVPLYSNLLQGAVIIKTVIVFAPILYVKIMHRHSGYSLDFQNNTTERKNSLSFDDIDCIY